MPILNYATLFHNIPLFYKPLKGKVFLDTLFLADSNLVVFVELHTQCVEFVSLKVGEHTIEPGDAKIRKPEINFKFPTLW